MQPRERTPKTSPPRRPVIPSDRRSPVRQTIRAQESARREALIAALRSAGYRVALRRGVVNVEGDGFALRARSLEAIASALLGTTRDGRAA